MHVGSIPLTSSVFSKCLNEILAGIHNDTSLGLWYPYAPMEVLGIWNIKTLVVFLFNNLSKIVKLLLIFRTLTMILFGPDLTSLWKKWGKGQRIQILVNCFSAYDCGIYGFKLLGLFFLYSLLEGSIRLTISSVIWRIEVMTSTIKFTKMHHYSYAQSKEVWACSKSSSVMFLKPFYKWNWGNCDRKHPR